MTTVRSMWRHRALCTRTPMGDEDQDELENLVDDYDSTSVSAYDSTSDSTSDSDY